MLDPIDSHGTGLSEESHALDEKVGDGSTWIRKQGSPTSTGMA